MENEKCEKIGAREEKVSLRGLSRSHFVCECGFSCVAHLRVRLPEAFESTVFACVQTPVHASFQEERKHTGTKCDRVG